MTNSNEWRRLREEYDAAIDTEEMNAWERENPTPEPQPPDCNYCKYIKEGFCAVNPSYLGDAANCPDYRPLFVI